MGIKEIKCCLLFHTKMMKSKNFDFFAAIVCGAHKKENGCIALDFSSVLLRDTFHCSWENDHNISLNSETCPCQRGGEQKEDWEWGFLFSAIF